MKLKRSAAIIWLAATPCLIYAQRQNPYLPGAPFSPPPGSFVIQPHPAEPVTSLDILIKMSRLIVDGVVTTVLPPININPNEPGAVETPSFVTIGSVLFGKAPNGNQILLIERGGLQGKWNVTVSGDQIVQPGGRYILFLNPVTGDIPNSAGAVPDSAMMPRFSVVGFANGKASVDQNGNIRFASGAIPSLLQYNNGAGSSFVSTLRARINEMFRPAPPCPVGVTPLPMPPNTITPEAAKRN